jgi:hypothetical protein
MVCLQNGENLLALPPLFPNGNANAALPIPRVPCYPLNVHSNIKVPRMFNNIISVFPQALRHFVSSQH